MKTVIKRNSMPTFFDEFFGDSILRSSFFPVNTEIKSTLPPINVKESEKDFQIELAVPGMEKSDFSITLENNILTITSEKKEEKLEDGEKYSRKEFGFFSFKRSFSLPEEKFDSELVEAKYESGILKVSVSKKIKKNDEPEIKLIQIS